MPNFYYNHGSNPINASFGSSSFIRDEFFLVETGFDNLPVLSGGNFGIVANSVETALIPSAFTVSLVGGLSTTGAFSTQFVQRASITTNLPANAGTMTTDATFPGFLTGLGLSNAVDTVNDIAVTDGTCASNSSSTIVSMNLPAGMTKRLDASWVAGDAAGGRCSPPIADGTWHCFVLILSNGTVDMCFDSNPTGTNVAASTAATQWRRIGSFRRFGGTIIQFTQVDDLFMLAVPFQEVATSNPGTSAVTLALSRCPEGLEVEAMIVVFILDSTSSAATFLIVSPLAITDTVPTSLTAQLANDTNAGAEMMSSTMLFIHTNTSRQIRYRMSASDADILVDIFSHGWYDRRGQYGGL